MASPKPSQKCEVCETPFSNSYWLLPPTIVTCGNCKKRLCSNCGQKKTKVNTKVQNVCDSCFDSIECKFSNSKVVFKFFDSHYFQFLKTTSHFFFFSVFSFKIKQKPHLCILIYLHLNHLKLEHISFPNPHFFIIIFQIFIFIQLLRQNFWFWEILTVLGYLEQVGLTHFWNEIQIYLSIISLTTEQCQPISYTFWRMFIQVLFKL